jgi:hypothetical protein
MSLEWFTGEDAPCETGHHRRVLRPRVGLGSLPSETVAAPVAFDRVIADEGPGWLSQELDAWFDNDSARERLVSLWRRLETEPSLMGMSAHLLSVAYK